MNGPAADRVRATEGVREIATPDDFLDAIAVRAGYVAITDRSVGTRVHKTSCAALNLAHFRTKVVEHRHRRGRYYATASYGALLARFKVKPCQICSPGAMPPPAPRAEHANVLSAHP